MAPFPNPGPLLRLAHRDLLIAATGTKDQVKALGNLSALPRPWDPPTCHDHELRRELWEWLETVVTWLIHEYCWDADDVIPPYWPQHPHLVHDVAVLADQRRRAGLAHTSDPLEDWHRYCLPAFLDRTRARVKDHCQDGHQPWAAHVRYARHTGRGTLHRQQRYASDLEFVQGSRRPHGAPPSRLTNGRRPRHRRDP